MRCGLEEHRRGEVRGEGERQAEGRSHLRAEGARAENPDRHSQPGARRRHDRLPRPRLVEQRHHLDDVVREAFGIAVQGAAERARGGRVGARGPAEAQIDAPGKERRQRAELLGHLQRRVVRQHDAARADADGRRAAADVRQQHGRGRAGDARHVVMLGEPEARVAEAFGMLRQLARAAEGVGGGAALEDRGEVEHRERHGHHAPTIHARWRRLPRAARVPPSSTMGRCRFQSRRGLVPRAG